MIQADYDQVYEFHKLFGIVINHQPNIAALQDQRRVTLRLKLINEEYTEFCTAFQDMNIIEMIDALGDLLYVIYGTCISFGFQVEQSCATLNHIWSIEQYIDQMKMEITNLEMAMANLSLSSTGNILRTMLQITYHCGYSILHVDLSKAFEIIHQSNMTKICSTEYQAMETIHWYQVHEPVRYKQPVYRKSEHPPRWIVYDQTTGKVLKNIHYQPPDLKPVLSLRL